MKVLLANGQGFLSKPRGALAGYRLTGPDIGGVPVYLATLTRALREQGCQIVNLHFGEPNERASRQDGEYVLPSRGRRVGLRALGQLRDIIAQEQPDIVHLHCVYYALSPLMLEALRKWLPVVLTMHDVSAICYWRTKIMRNGECCTSPVGARCLTSGCYSLAADGRRLSNLYSVLLNRFQLQVYRRLLSVVVPSRYLADELINNGFARDRVTVIPHCSPKPVERSLTRHEHLRILYVGRIIREKGIADLLHALERLKESQWTLDLIGGGSWLEEGINLSRRLCLEHKVVFRGELHPAAVDDYYRNCGFVVMPSLGPESFGLVGVEAMSFGKPVVAYDAGGTAEWMMDGITGFLVPRGDIHCLAEKMKCLLENADLRDTMGQAGMERVKTRFNVKTHVSGLLEVYRETIEEFERKAE